jgi:putative transposase
MKGSRFSEEQIIGILREQEAGAKTQDVCRRHGIPDAKFFYQEALRFRCSLVAAPLLYKEENVSCRTLRDATGMFDNLMNPL